MVWFGIFMSAVFGAGEGVYSIPVDRPLEHLFRQYERAQVLAIAETDHRAVGAWQLLDAFLRSQRIRNDRRLRFLVVERSIESADFYRELGFRGLTRAQAAQVLPADYGSARYYMCDDFPSTPFVLTHVTEAVRRINQLRQSGADPLEIVAIDSLGMASEERWGRDPIYRSVSGGCRSEFPARFAFSHNREQETARAFQENVLSRLKPDEKAIILYHATHLFRTGEICRPSHRGAGVWEERVGPISWFALALPQIEGQVRSVIVDQQIQAVQNQREDSPLLSLFNRNVRSYRFAVDFHRADIPDTLRMLRLSQFPKIISSVQNPDVLSYGQEFDGLIWWGDASGTWSAPDELMNEWCSLEY